MPRNGEAVHRRLQQAALELFLKCGYESTTAAEIAACAGVTERTYFRHFPDKRDILFAGDELVVASLTTAIVNAPAGLRPLAVLRTALRSLEAIFEGNREFSKPRQAVIAATPALREREASKQASLIAATASALGQRGVDAKTALLAAQVGAVAFGHALSTWLGDASQGLDVHLDRAFEEMRVLNT